MKPSNKKLLSMSKAKLVRIIRVLQEANTNLTASWRKTLEIRHDKNYVAANQVLIAKKQAERNK